MSSAKGQSNTDPDLDAVRSCQRGEPGAFRLLFNRYREPMVRLAYRYSGCLEEAEDLAQEIFVRLFQRIDSFRFESSFSTWLYRLAVHQCLNHSRSKREVTPFGESVEPAGGENPAEVFQRSEREKEALNAVAGLPENLKVVFLLVGVEHRSYVETAEILGLSVEAVRMRMSRARRELKARLIDEGGAR